MELNLITIGVILFVAVGCTYLGVLLGRRSTTANETVDRIRAEYDRRVADLQRRIEEAKAAGKGKD